MLFAKHDVTSLQDWKRVVAEVEEHFGASVTVLVNNAGIIGPVVSTVDIEEEDSLEVVAVNQHSQFSGMKSVIPSMQKAGGGTIVTISSTAGMVSISKLVLFLASEDSSPSAAWNTSSTAASPPPDRDEVSGEGAGENRDPPCHHR